VAGVGGRFSRDWGTELTNSIYIILAREDWPLPGKVFHPPAFVCVRERMWMCDYILLGPDVQTPLACTNILRYLRIVNN